MQNLLAADKRAERVSALVSEVIRGEHKKDILVNSALDFANEVQADYFSNTRRHMCSDTAYIVMNCSQQISDLDILRRLKEHE